MGNWHRVKIEGTCGASDVNALRQHLFASFDDARWGCLHNGGICGLPNWAAENIDAVGNLGERDFTPDSVAEELFKIAQVAPSLAVTVHFGADNEGDACVKSIVLKGGAVTVEDPKIAEVPVLDGEAMRNNLMNMMRGAR